VGVISTTRAGAFWPYRLITRIFARLLEQYTDRFTIETDTPVSKVDLDPSSDPEHPYILTTSRGKVRASKVIYCSNGWTGHLLPRLQGKIFPVRGTMSVQKAGPDFSNQGNTRSWSAVTKPSYNAAENTLATGLYYVNQNAHTGDIFIGGEKQHPSEIISSDDTIVSEVSRDRLGQVLPEMFEKGWREGEKPEVKQVWSGIMGVSDDMTPLKQFLADG
jgi:glycine/D-amino acid oxidase-like deaminating enzyme